MPNGDAGFQPTAGTTGGGGGTQTAGGSAGGTLGQGGNSGDGGGGGGYYGGGAAFSGGGGGGSSWAAAGLSGVAYSSGPGGDGSLTIAPVGTAAPALDGTNFTNVPGTWSVSGSDVYRASGNVGIGTSSPTATLEVTGSASTVKLGGLAPAPAW
jgi:hypothetical protein